MKKSTIISVSTLFIFLLFSNFASAQMITGLSGTVDPDGPGGLSPVAVMVEYLPVPSNFPATPSSAYRVQDAAMNLVGWYEILVQDSPTQFTFENKLFVVGDPIPGTGDDSIILTGAFGLTFAAIPSMSQWALLIFGLLMMSLGIVAIGRSKLLGQKA